MTKTIKADIEEILGFPVKTRNKIAKITMLAGVINTSKYEIIGFPGGGNKVLIRTRFHNKRDKKGRFSCNIH